MATLVTGVAKHTPPALSERRQNLLGPCRLEDGSEANPCEIGASIGKGCDRGHRRVVHVPPGEDCPFVMRHVALLSEALPEFDGLRLWQISGTCQEALQ